MALSDNMRGAVLMNVAMCAFTVNDTCMKLASAGLPLFQVITLRGLATTAVLVILAARQGVLGFVPRGADAAMISVRSLAEVLGDQADPGFLLLYTRVAAYLRPGLTTIALPHEEMGRLAIQLLLSDQPPAEHLVEMPVIHRQSLPPLA